MRSASASASCGGRSRPASMRARCNWRPGLTIDATTLKTELDAAAYHDRRRRAPGHLRPQRRALADLQPRLQRRRRRRAGAPDRGRAVGRPRRLRCARPGASAVAEVRAAGPGPHRHAVRPEAGRTPAGAHRGSARTAGDRPAGGRGPRFQPPSRHRRRPAWLRAAWVNMRRARHQAGRQHADPAARAQRPARHRPRADADPQGQGDPLRAADRGALRQAHDPGGLPQPGLPGPARRAGDPRRRRRLRSSGSAATCAT